MLTLGMPNRLQDNDEEDTFTPMKVIFIDTSKSPTTLQRKKTKLDLFYRNFSVLMLIVATAVAIVTIILIQYVINKN